MFENKVWKRLEKENYLENQNKCSVERKTLTSKLVGNGKYRHPLVSLTILRKAITSCYALNYEDIHIIDLKTS